MLCCVYEECHMSRGLQPFFVATSRGVVVFVTGFDHCLDRVLVRYGATVGAACEVSILGV